MMVAVVEGMDALPLFSRHPFPHPLWTSWNSAFDLHSQQLNQPLAGLCIPAFSADFAPWVVLDECFVASNSVEEAIEEFKVLEGMGFNPEDCIQAVIKHPGVLDQQVVLLLPA
jgi:hypothetical protein